MVSWLIEQNVDVSKPPKQAVSFDLMFPLDNNAHTWQINVFQDGTPCDLSGGTVSAYFLRRDGETVTVQGTISGNTCTVTLAQECYAIVGTVAAGMRYANGSDIITLAYRVFNVLPPFDSESYIDPGTAIPSIVELLAAISDMEKATTEAAAVAGAIADSAGVALTFEQGSISTQTGMNASSTAANNARRVRTAIPFLVEGDYCSLMVQSGLNAQIIVYSNDTLADSSFIETLALGEYDLREIRGKYIRILLSKTDNTQNLTPQEVTASTYILKSIYDSTLTEENKAAEAKVVGEVFARDAAIHNLIYSGTMLHDYYMTSTPSTATTPIPNSGMNTTDFIAVKGGETIVCHGFRRYWWYKSDKSVVSNSSTGNLNDKAVFDSVTGAKLMKAPQSAAYIRVCYRAVASETSEADTDVYLYRPTAYDQYLYGNMFAGTGKKYVALGSSSVAGTYSEIGNPQSVGIDPNVSFVRWIAEYNGYSITNLGVGGMGWRNKSKASAGGRNAAETIDYYYQPTANPPVNDFADASIITLYFGTNDWKGQWGASDTDAGDGWTLGDMTSTAATNGTVIGAMKYTLEKLIEAAPQAQIIVVLPGNFKKLGNAKTGDESNPELDVVDGISYAKVENRYALGTHNVKGDTLADYHAAIKECANYYGVRFVNAGEICAANLLNIDHMLGDGIHPTPEYYKQMGYSLAPFIK